MNPLVDKTCLTYWFPKLWDAGLPIPLTRIVHTHLNLNTLSGDKTPEGYESFLDELRAAANDLPGPPWFLRTGHTSGKHDWRRTCFLDSVHNLDHHAYALIEFSQMADFMGLPTDVWAVREMLPVDPAGYLQRFGGMPLVREFRGFIRDGEVICTHPYWPPVAIEQGGGTEDMATAVGGTITIDAADLLQRTADTFAGDGAWSADILETRHGYYVTDMAEAGKSWHWPDCPHAKEFERK